MAIGAYGQLQTWRVGGTGDAWNDVASSQSGALEVDGGLQPLELETGANLLQLLQASGLDWINDQPDDYRASGQPRTWSRDGLFNQVDGPLALVDGNPSTSSENIFKAAINQSGASFFWDFGAPFPLNRIRFFPDPNDEDSFIKAFEIRVNDGETYNDINRPVYETLRRVEVNAESVVDLEFAPLQGRFLQLLVLSKTPFNLAEFEVYGEGFVPVASYESELHPFGASVNFGDLRLWSSRLVREGGEEADANDRPTAVFQMRTGADDSPFVYIRRDRETGAQEEVSFEEYNSRLPRQALFQLDPETGALLGEVDRTTYFALPVNEQGPVRDFVKGDIRGDVDNWSPWSVPITIDSTGAIETPVSLQSPRGFLQFRVAFSGDADNVIRIDSLEIDHFPGLVTDAVGELALASDPRPETGIPEVAGGVDTSFVLDIRTDFVGANLPGYRGMRVTSFPAPVFEHLLVGDPLQPLADAQVLPTDDGFDVFFDPVTAANNQPLRVSFKMRLLEHNTPINVWLINDVDSPPHPVRPGDASEAISTGVTNAFTLETRPIVEARLSTTVVTPNGDGINDATGILLILSQFTGDVDVDVEIFDLSGRRVRHLISGRQPAGASNESWDARDDGGDLVPPGLYLLRVRAKTDAETFQSAQSMGVVY
ncbi:MAG: hypothetical protein HN712_16135 [Gemmatimonadetes bacterium]|nr:hypothetical protein [Gemmatimonadota bacterium]MBT6147500.1 hypothetical protein [Gemmatimonadota bacterium]MBT7861844.1 hypothetical protein [Gemmatimonadota bacterium]